jgi:hypothetical protein
MTFTFIWGNITGHFLFPFVGPLGAVTFSFFMHFLFILKHTTVKITILNSCSIGFSDFCQQIDYASYRFGRLMVCVTRFSTSDFFIKLHIELQIHWLKPFQIWIRIRMVSGWRCQWHRLSILTLLTKGSLHLRINKKIIHSQLLLLSISTSFEKQFGLLQNIFCWPAVVLTSLSTKSAISYSTISAYSNLYSKRL